MRSSKNNVTVIVMFLAVILSSSCSTDVPPATDAKPTSAAPTVLVGGTKKEVTLTISAQFLATNQPIQCPPICMEVDNPSSGPDTTKPLSFEVCSAIADCIQLESGIPIKVYSDATIKAPDGISRGQQLPAMEKELYLRFQRWDDGSTNISRNVGSSRGVVNLVAYYAAWKPVTVSTTASERGCGTDAGILLGTSSQWAPVQDQPEFTTIEGPVTDSHVSDTDFPGNHSSNDVNMWVLLSGEEPFKMLSQEQSGQYGNRPNQIVVEWEEGSYPTWAWAGRESINIDEPAIPNIDDADLVWVKGKWIYDCGHEDDAILQGAWTEIHPPVATAVMRGTRQGKLLLKEDIAQYFPELNPRATGLQGVQADLWINGDGGGAVTSVKCAKIWAEGAGCLVKPVFDIRGIYEFDVPLPSAPSPLYPEARFLMKFLRLQPGQPQPVVTPVSITNAVNKLHVTVDLSDYTDSWQTCKQQNILYGENLINCQGDAYGVTILAGWEVFEYPPDLHRVRVTVNNIQIFENKEGEGGDGEYKLWLEAGPSAALAGDPLNPSTVALHNINPNLKHVPGNGEAYPLLQNGTSLTFLYDIRANSSESNKLRLLLHGFEDDPIWDDELRELLRVFYANYTIWQPDNVYPDWVQQPPLNCSNSTLVSCSYGKETIFGTVRTNSSPPIRYGDPVWGECAIPCVNHLLDYTIEELILP